VPEGTHGSSAKPPVVVATPPPPAKIERVPRSPRDECRWLDGRWDWGAEAWEWKAGAWVLPSAGCYFAPPEALWVTATGKGLLFYLPGQWYRDGGAARCSDPRPCS
jgi:hypothetical protein